MIVSFANGRQIEFNVFENGDFPPCFLLGVRKSGSSLLNNICTALAKAYGRCFVECAFLRNNMKPRDWQNDPALRTIIRPSVVYGGFRDAPLSLFDDPAFVNAPKFMLVRDPRDALVSEYFSNAYSHPVPAAQPESAEMQRFILERRQEALATDLQAYVRKSAQAFARTLGLYAPVLEMPNLRCVKYEDVILKKSNLIMSVAEHFGFPVDEATVQRILRWADVVPSQEDPKAFVRRVRPGDHAEKLSVETLAAIAPILNDAMVRFGYPSPVFGVQPAVTAT